MTFQTAAVVLFAGWLVIGAALGVWPLRHLIGPGSFHVQSLYDSHDEAAEPGDAAGPTRIRLAQRLP